MNVWFTGAGEQIAYEDIIEIIAKHTINNGKVFIGTDSFNLKTKTVFANAICLHGAINARGGRYFIRKTSVSSKNFPNLVTRMLSEVEKTIEIALDISNKVVEADIELHLDISASSKNNGTSRFAELLTGYAKSTGFECKIKPYAFAAASVADKHSK
ncbi:MAG TPA: hypothetical protein DEG69_21990 [Flavobacteriaceae bacterium]|jgi:predicted RNase H-related nuclease YkuK (DUF458 family)|nr:hypothetical protein [Flavobacteriaceae bacterium]